MKRLLLLLLCAVQLCVLHFANPAFALEVDVTVGYNGSGGAACNGSTDDYTVLQTIIDNVPIGTKLIVPGVCKTTGELDFDGKSELIVEGTGWATNGGPASASGIYYAGNAGRSAVSLAGAVNITMRDLEIYTRSTTPPKAALLIGRTGGSGGTHTFDHVAIRGYATEALVYSIASEANMWGGGSQFSLYGGGAKYLYATSFQDFLSFGGLTSSSNCMTFFNHVIMGVDNTHLDNSATVFIQTTDASGSQFVFRDSYIGNFGAQGDDSSYIEINMAGNGGPFGKFLFDGVYAEGGDPTYGMKISTAGGTARTLTGLTLTNSELNSATDYFLYGANNTNISHSKIEENYYSKPSSVYDFDFNRLQYRTSQFIVRNHAFQNDMVIDDSEYAPSINSQNKNRIFYQKTGTQITGAQGGFYYTQGGVSGTVDTDLAAGSVVRLTLTGNITVAAPTNAIAGQNLTYIMQQYTPGGYTVTWNGVFKQNWTPTTTAWAYNSITFVYDGTNWVQTAERTGL